MPNLCRHTPAVTLLSALATEKTEGRLAALYGTDEQKRYEGAISGSLSDSVRGRLAGLSSSTDGYIDNNFNADTGPSNDQ